MCLLIDFGNETPRERPAEPCLISLTAILTKKKTRLQALFRIFFWGHLCGAFLPCLHGNGKNCAASPRLFFLFPVFPHAHAWGFRGCAAPPALAPAMRETRERVLPRGTSSKLRTGANQAPADEADCVAPTHPPAETAGALKASKRRHNPKNPGREPGDKPHPKTNPSLGEAAQSPRRVSAFSIRARTRGRLLLSLKRKSVPAGKPCGDASFRRAFFRTRRRADFRCRRCADARRSCPAADRARGGNGDCLRGIRGRRCRRGFLSARRRPDR